MNIELLMSADPLMEKLENGEVALGTWCNYPGQVNLLADLGFDWFMLDQMWTQHGWKQTDELIYAAEAAGITAIPRVHSYPWSGYDHRVVAHVMRNLARGARYVLVSHSGEGEIEECLEAAEEWWHQRPLSVHPFNSLDEWDDVTAEIRDETHIIPQPETKESLAGLEETIKHPSVDIFQFAMSDASRVLTGQDTPQWYADEVWDLVDRAVELGEEHDTIIGANTSYAYDIEELVNRVEKLADHGVQLIKIQGLEFIFKVAANDMMNRIDERL